jgi:CBS domain-containing protein
MRSREPVSAYSHRDVVSVAEDMTIRQAAATLFRSGIGLAVIMGEQGVAGVFSERDIVEALAAGADPDVTLVGAGMTRSVVTVRPDDTVLDTLLVMVDDDIRHAPLVDDLGHLQGIVSVRDLLRPLVLQAMTPDRSDREARKPMMAAD